MASGKAPTNLKTRQCIKDWILTAIDQLKLRKARPDRYRIAYVLNKQFGVDIDAVNEVLEQMTDEHSIVRVDYKGSVSYRDIKNWLRVSKDIEEISMYAGAFVLNSDRASAAIKEAVKLLSTDSKSSGVSSTELEQYFEDKTHNRYTTAPLAVALQREVNAGHLLKSGKNYFSVRKPSNQSKQSEMHRMDSPTSDGTSDGNDAVNDSRKRVKKTKVIFDPSEEVRSRPASDLPPAKRQKKMAISVTSGGGASASSAGRGTTTRAAAAATPTPAPAPVAATPTPAPAPASSPAAAPAPAPARHNSGRGAATAAGKRACNFCHKQGRQEVVLVCRQCKTPAHPSCLGYSKRLARTIQDQPWTCMDCKSCTLCWDVGGELIFCDKCDQAFHMSCHKPPVRRKPIGEWMCSSCRGGKLGPGRPSKLAWKPEASASSKPEASKSPAKAAAAASSGGGTKPATKPANKPSIKPSIKPATKPASATKQAGAGAAMRLSWPAQLMAAPLDPSVPDASDWSVTQVAAYFGRHGFSQHTAHFEKHEVDGAALLMLSRIDVLRGLGIKLGPALKIYNHVKLLQTRRRACLDFCLL